MSRLNRFSDATFKAQEATTFMLMLTNLLHFVWMSTQGCAHNI